LLLFLDNPLTPDQLLNPEYHDCNLLLHSTMASTVQKVTIILDSSKAWHDWLEVVKTKARAGKVWEYVDPSLTADQVLKLIEPKKPKPSLISSKVPSISILANENERPVLA
jgi:hypothetical protein